MPSPAHGASSAGIAASRPLARASPSTAGKTLLAEALPQKTQAAIGQERSACH